MNTKEESNSVAPKKQEKEFLKRNSLLIDLFENRHIRNIYNLFLAIFLGLFVNIVISDYLGKGEANFGLRLISTGFAKIHIVVLAWIGYFAITCLAYAFFKVWAYNRSPLTSKHAKMWDMFWLILLLNYYMFSFILASYIITVFKLPAASSAIVVAEQTRLLMKAHSFVRSNITTVQEQSHNAKISLPKFSSFLYFLFIPTLIYRDAYPRTTSIDWSFAFYRLLEVFGAILFISFILERLINPSIQDFGVREYTIREVILVTFENIVGGILILLSIFFLVLHSWQNLFAEITRFGDRMFYRDWWTSTNLSEYFRKWNVVVQEWLHLYVYQELTNHTVGKFAVFIVSAIVHEWILTFMLGFFFPLLFFEFLISALLLTKIQPPKNNIFNVLFWYILPLGTGTLVTFYGLEFYARANVPYYNYSFTNSIIPRFLTCGSIVW